MFITVANYKMMSYFKHHESALFEYQGVFCRTEYEMMSIWSEPPSSDEIHTIVVLW